MAVKLAKREKCHANSSQCFLMMTVFNIRSTENFSFVSQFVFKCGCFSVLQLRVVQLHAEDIHFVQD